MQSRRKLLTGLGTAAAVTLAGCSQNALSEPDPPAEGDFEANLQAFHPSEDAACTGRDEGEITIGQHPDFANQISFDGVLLTPNPCYEAELSEQTYDEESGVYTITIAAVKSGSDMCESCIGETTYSGGITFEGDFPLTVKLEHESEPDGATKTVDLM